MSDFDGLVDEFARFRDDPVYGVQSLFGVDPTPQQAQLLRAAAVPGAHVSVRSGHGTGKHGIGRERELERNWRTHRPGVLR